MPVTATDGMRSLSQSLQESALLRALGVQVDEAEAGYVELSAPAEAAAEGGCFSAGAAAALAEAAARMAIGDRGETAELSLHLHGLGPVQGAARIIARGESLREAQPGRPLATASADVFRVDADGAEALLASALVSIIAEG